MRSFYQQSQMAPNHGILVNENLNSSRFYLRRNLALITSQIASQYSLQKTVSLQKNDPKNVAK